ncbi:UNKNOWN [Stylonychia lemnae]|uniref:Uncharacterized protein n=1 Tax=Stylonychia lemnae TaxID=5949 RepID=A0A078B4L9_STYLE|nr:UNKNOWN [Stylonychia lemnae]|eukprot:CDW88172.1 UNKNOWN [Stylonychia lemnae]
MFYETGSNLNMRSLTNLHNSKQSSKKSSTKNSVLNHQNQQISGSSAGGVVQTGQLILQPQRSQIYFIDRESQMQFETIIEQDQEGRSFLMQRDDPQCKSQRIEGGNLIDSELYEDSSASSHVYQMQQMYTLKKEYSISSLDKIQRTRKHSKINQIQRFQDDKDSNNSNCHQLLRKKFTYDNNMYNRISDSYEMDAI